MGFRNPITTAADPAARAAAAQAETDAQAAGTAAATAQSTANAAAAAAAAANTAAATAATAAATAQSTATAASDAAQHITATQITDGAVTTPKLAAGAVTAATIAAGTITGAQIAAGTIQAANIAAGTIQAAQIAAGTITGAQLAATAIDGKTITGGTLRTAGAGRRVELSSTQGDRVDWYTGDAQEAAAGRLWVSVTQGSDTSNAKDQGYLMLAPPELGGSVATPEASLTVYGQTRDGTSKGSFQFTGDLLVVKPGGAANLTQRHVTDTSSGFVGVQTVSVPSQSSPATPVIPSTYLRPVPSQLLSVAGGTFTTQVSGVWALQAEADSGAVVAGFSQFALNLTAASRSTYTDQRQRAAGYAAAGTIAQPLAFVDWLPAGATFSWSLLQITSSGIATSYSVTVSAQLIA